MRVGVFVCVCVCVCVYILWQTPGRNEGSGRSGNLLAPPPSHIWTSSRERGEPGDH